MNFNFPDPLENYISDQTFRRIIYFFSVIFIGLPIIYLFWQVILVLGIIYLSYKKIEDEKVKWSVITVLTISLLISSTYKVQNSSYKENLTPENSQSKIKLGEESSEKSTDEKSDKTKEDEKVSNNSIVQNNNTNTELQKSSEPELKTYQGFSEEGSEKNVSSELFLVTKVIDGDTIEIEGGKRVRYIGIDTPETVHPSKPVECFGKEASAKNQELVLNKKVRLEKDVSETDKYGRLLRYVYAGDIFVNDYLVSEGYAKSSTYPPDVKYNEKFLASQKIAVENEKGLWGNLCNNTEVLKTTTQTITQNVVPQTNSVSEKEESSSSSYSEVVKKSSTGICHAPGTTYYSRTKNFTPYSSLDECLESGGRLPKR